MIIRYFSLAVAVGVVAAFEGGKSSAINTQVTQLARVDKQKTNNLPLKVVSVGVREVRLSWQNSSSENARFFNVYRSTKPNFVARKAPGVVVFNIPIRRETVEFYDPTAKPNTSYFYRVVMHSSYTDRVLISNLVAVKTKPFKGVTKPQPTILKLNEVSPLRVISMSWTPYKGKDFLSYRIYRSMISGFNPNNDDLLDENKQASQTRWGDIGIMVRASLKMVAPQEYGGDTPFPKKLYYKIGVYKTDYTETFSNQIAVTLPAPSRKFPTPSVLALMTASNSRATLEWTTPNNLNVIGYQLHRSNQSGFAPEYSTIVGGDYDANIEGKSGGSKKTEDKGLQPQTKYFYKVVTFNIDGLSSQSNEIVVETLAPPSLQTAPKPVALKLVSPPTYDSIALQWTKSDDPNFYSYDLCLLENSTDTPEMNVSQGASDINDTSFDYDFLSEGTTYYYVVVVRNKFDQTTVSNVVKATTRQRPPRSVKLTAHADAGHSVIQVQPNGTQTSTKIAPQLRVDLSWTGQISDDAGSYIIYRGEEPQFATTKKSLLISFGASAAGWDDRTVKPGQTYFYKIVYVANNGQNLTSNEAKVLVPAIKTKR